MSDHMFVDKVKNQLDIVDVARKYRTVYRSGSQYETAIDQNSKSGRSLSIDPRRQVFYDFAGEGGGDVLDLIASFEGLGSRNSDFPRVLKIAADYAGLKIPEYNDSEKTKKARELYDLYTDISEHYHEELLNRPEIVKHIKDKWGITEETINSLKIGFAPVERSLDKFKRPLLNVSGLLLKFSTGDLEFFNGRIVFPYWKNGKVVYMIARKVDGYTPENKYEAAKYKKLLTPSEERPYISPLVGNHYLYGEDSIRHADEWILITEGVTDCITAIQAGIPTISPVTTKFREADYEKIKAAARRVETVYICNDNEESGAGLKGALSTADMLEEAGIMVKIVTLPRGDKDKVDLAEYLQDHSKEEFEELLEVAPDTWTFRLENTKVPGNTREKTHALKKFIKEDIRFKGEVEKEEFIKTDVAGAFGMKARSVDKIIKEVKNSFEGGENFQNVAQDEAIQTDETHFTDDERKKAKKEALRILQEDDPLEYLMETVKNIHVGDEQAEEGIIIGMANQSCLNTQGIQIKLSGESGTGKTHVTKAVTHLLRKKHIKETSLSAKAAYYMNLAPGTVIFSDDVDISEDMEDLIKRATSNYQEITTHTTVKDQEAQTVHVPQRIMWLLTSKNDDVSDQMLNRQLVFNTDATPEHKNSIFEMQKRQDLLGENFVYEVTFRVLVCREILDNIKTQIYKVIVPFVDDIEVRDKTNSRNYPMFSDMMKGYALLKHMQRKKDENGKLLAEHEDFYRAKKLFESQQEGILSKLNDKERKILQVIGQMGDDGATINQIVTLTGMNYDRVRYAVEGRKNRDNGGLLEKVRGLIMEDVSTTYSITSEDIKTSKKHKIYKLKVDFNPFELYGDSWVYLKSEEHN
jgi:DNA primase catalytic core